MTFENYTKTLLIYTVSYFNLGMLQLILGDKTPNPPGVAGLLMLQKHVFMNISENISTLLFM